MPEFKDILTRIDEAITKFNKVIPKIQKEIFSDIQDELKRLDTVSGKIKPTVSNLKVIISIKNKMLRLILTPEYMDEVKDYIKAFNDVTKLQNQYWQSVEKEFKPRPLLREIKNQAIDDTIKSLTASGIGSTIQEQIGNILRTNITTGGSYADLNDQLRESLVNTETDGVLLKYTKQITTDAINQYSAQYTQTVSNDLGFEWFGYQGSDIRTTRPFCDAMTDRRYFHVTEIPDLLAAKDLYYIKDGQKTKVPIYKKTELPHGMIPGTNASNFQINRGGYNCGHQIRPVSESLVPKDIKERVFASNEYKLFRGDDIIEKETKLPEKEQLAQKPIAPEAEKPKAIAKKEKELNLDALMVDHESFENLLRQNRPVYEEKQKEFPDLSVEEILSAKMYANTTYRQLNDHLRNPDNTHPIKKDYYDNFDTLLKQTLGKLPDYKGIVYRGSDLDGITLEHYENAFKTGKPIIDKGFMSTSTDEAAAFDKNAFFIIKSKSGKNIENLVDDHDEKEVLFTSGSKFKITEMRSETIRGKKKTLIKMEEI